MFHNEKQCRWIYTLVSRTKNKLFNNNFYLNYIKNLEINEEYIQNINSSI